jgi:hypothetical protein
MSKAVFRRCWPLFLGFVVPIWSAGCGESPDASPDSGIAGTKGVADPKYAQGTDEQYRQQHLDSLKAGATKGKAATSQPANKPAPAEAGKQ